MKEIMKYVLLSLCIVAIEIIVMFLNNISQGNVLGIGMADFILKCIGLWHIYFTLYKYIFK